MEQVPFLGRKGLEGRVVCGVVCGREGEKERRRGRGRREREKERKGSLSIPIHKLPCGADPSWDSPNTLQTLSYTLSLNPYPSNPDPKMGDPHLLPTRGKGGKRGGKEHLPYILSSIFLSGGEPPDPPF